MDSGSAFVCTREGCGQSFASEAELSGHTKRHDMVLNFSLTAGKSHAFSADQTPTPTRFIRNCEEVGLFQDLQNVNPFEETFRKAAELAKCGGEPPRSVAPADDTLHTPKIFLQEAAVTVAAPTGNRQMCAEHDYASGCSTPPKATRRPRRRIAEAKRAAPRPRLEIRPKMEVVAVEPLPRHMVFVKERLKQAILRTETLPQVPANGVLCVDAAKIVVPVLHTAARGASSLRKPGQPAKAAAAKAPPVARSERRKSDGEPKADAQKWTYLERNRAAAMRSRERRKKWIADMEENLRDSARQIDALKAENQDLRAEVELLKAMLLEHKDCSVTHQFGGTSYERHEI